MQRRLPPLNSLRAFEAAARLGSFKKAASELHVTHGAVSRHVQLLEDWLGVPMFRRLNRRVVLTDPGKAYLAEIGAAFDRIALATSHHVARGRTSLLQVSATATLTLRWLIPRLSRLRMRNASDDIHPIHLHRHSFELTRVAGQPTSGVVKDVVMVGGYQEVEIDFVADNPGLTLFHCHQQVHMDFGFMALFEYGLR